MTEGDLKSGERIVVDRPLENSPSSISTHQTKDQIINATQFNTLSDEAAWIAQSIENEIVTQGVAPEDILVICADDRNSQTYFRALKSRLKDKNIIANDLSDDSFSIRDFQSEGKVTLSTVYKVKGNEAYVVFVCGIDALFYSPTPKNRNRAFTAMTRAKGWLSITGIGEPAKRFAIEISLAKRQLPSLVFEYPKPEELVVMKRDLLQVTVDEADETITRLAQDLDSEEIEQIMRKLRLMKSKRKPRKKL